MAYDPKRKVNAILRKLKRAARIPYTPTQKANALKKQAVRMGKNLTEPERLSAQILDELGLEYETQKIVGGKIFDFFIPSANLLFEVDGDYWHAYGLLPEEMNGMQRKSVKNDKKKDIIAKGYGYELLRVWEHEINNDYEKVKEKVKYYTTNSSSLL
jgi:very-short-patch-repair endonuclease